MKFKINFVEHVVADTIKVEANDDREAIRKAIAIYNEDPSKYLADAPYEGNFDIIVEPENSPSFTLMEYDFELEDETV